jgi:hypothetical protein
VIKWTGVAVVVRTTFAILVTLLADSGRAADERGLPATSSVLANIVANTADVRTAAPARRVFLNDFNDRFEPWLELLLKQAGFGSTKMLLNRGAQTLTASRHVRLESQNRIVYVKNIAKCLANAAPDDVDTYLYTFRHDVATPRTGEPQN